MRRALVVVALLAACGGSQKTEGTMPTVEDFDCRERRIEYALTGGFVAVESGVAVWCDGDSAYLDSWRLVDGGTERKSDKNPMSQLEFEELWKKIESTGWRNLSDCDNPDAADDDPVYTIDVRDHSVGVSFTCQGKQPPFPYDRLINELDLKAAGFTQ